MLKLGRVTKLKMLFLVLVFVFNFDLFKFSAAILEKGLLKQTVDLFSNCCLVSSVGRAPVCCAGGQGFEPQIGPTLRVLR